MSTAMKSVIPAARATAAAPTAPPAGPEPITATAFCATQPPVEPREVALDLRADVGVHERRRGALELGRGGQHLVRERDHHPRQLLGRDLAHAALVGGIHEGEEQYHRE